MEWGKPKNLLKLLNIEHKLALSQELSSEEEDLEQDSHRENGKRIVLSGLVKKMKYLVMYNTR